MLKIDISKAISPRLGTYLLGIIPGLFFESSLAIGNTQLAAAMISRVREIYAFGPYALLIIFLALAVFIGQAFFLTAWITGLLINLAFVLPRYAIKVTFGSNWLYQRFGKWQGMPPKHSMFIRILGKTIFWARRQDAPFEARPVLKCLYIATKQLLKARYGIDRSFGTNDPEKGNEWGVWYGLLGKPPRVYQEAPIVARTFAACGLAGCAVLYVLPPLRERYFIVLTLIFSFAGLIPLMSLARWRSHPVKRSVERLQWILFELSETATTKEEQKSDSKDAPSQTISVDDHD